MTHERNFLIAPECVQIDPYYQKWRDGFHLTGYIQVSPYTAPPVDKAVPTYNRFCAIATEALVLRYATQTGGDGFMLDAKVEALPAFVVPVFVNDEPTTILFDPENDPMINQEKPYIAFFKGNDDWHYAMRFVTSFERQRMLKFFGEDLGFLVKDLIVHN